MLKNYPEIVEENWLELSLKHVLRYNNKLSKSSNNNRKIYIKLRHHGL